jgi:hypothetical protein
MDGKDRGTMDGETGAGRGRPINRDNANHESRNGNERQRRQKINDPAAEAGYWLSFLMPDLIRHPVRRLSGYRPPPV